MGQIPLLPAKGRANVLRYLVDKPASAGAEAIRNLRTSVLLANVDLHQQVILMTSSVPGEGKTSISFSLAQNLAMMGKSVLLIEGDLRRRVFGNYIAAASETQKGLASVLSGGASFDEAVV
ncbi:CpsD/CapB family tyrosine-protein kinase, partial [Thioclava sp. BHET1]